MDVYRIRLARPPGAGLPLPACRRCGVAGKQASKQDKTQAGPGGQRQAGNGSRRRRSARCDFASSFACPIVSKPID